MKLIGLLFFIISFDVMAVGCDCEVRVYAPLTASHKSPPVTLKLYELEEFSSYSPKNQRECRRLCEIEFEKNLTTQSLKNLLLEHSQNLIQGRVVGYNCTGLTTLKYPVRVKASLGSLGLGNVSDTIEVVNHEEPCF